ncbi:TPA: TIGR02391 family protein [Corynebacterium striatum]|nr:restriction endonuclease [Corynebacterium striatum]HAT1477401.1 restriction endonuclease [Corynebacterium striatum]HAT6526657.1 restriction endonuclease [Corynebacterium striatum]HAT6564808.1 restriction endonuclease [Corynebacterium striatum]HAT6570202.1 restriction endonuclease [Corynebacterium striatum]
MNIDWALKELDNFTFLTERVPHPSPNVIGSFPRGSKADIASQAQIAEKIMDRVTPGWRSGLASVKPGTWDRHYEAAVRARAQLQRAEEIAQNLGENAPELSAAELHPWIWDGAKSLWQSGHYREAVSGAIRKLNAETQNKIGRRDVSETNLFKQAFSTDQSKEGSSRLRRMKDDGSDTYKSVQRGAMTFAEGVFAGIRNPLSHEADQELREQEALEYLAALSVLARWVDDSTVEGTS